MSESDETQEDRVRKRLFQGLPRQEDPFDLVHDYGVMTPSEVEVITRKRLGFPKKSNEDTDIE